MAQTKLSVNLVAVDIGNSAIKVGYFHGSDLISKDVYKTRRRNAPRLPSVEKILISSVVPSLDIKFKHLYPAAQWISRNSIPIQDIPLGVGIDRIVALHAATKLYGKNVIVIDMGTAMTMTCAIQGVFKGGAICPGRFLQKRILAKGTAQLPITTSTDIPRVLLESKTNLAIDSGIHHLLTLGIEQMIAKAIAELGKRMLVIATGGDSLRLAEHIPAIQIVNPDLILQGIHLLSQEEAVFEGNG